MFYYIVKHFDGQRYGTVGCCSPAEMLLVVPSRNKFLPVSFGNLAMLHKIHANLSQAMRFDDATGAFQCVHCDVRLNVSKGLFGAILFRLSEEALGNIPIKDPETHTSVQFCMEVDSFLDPEEDNVHLEQMYYTKVVPKTD